MTQCDSSFQKNYINFTVKDIEIINNSICNVIELLRFSISETNDLEEIKKIRKNIDEHIEVFSKVLIYRKRMDGFIILETDEE